MASPQLENGYARLANEITRALYQIPLSGSQYRVILWVVKNSYGWSRKFAPHESSRVIGKELRMSKSEVHRALETLVKERVLRKNAAGHWELEKDYDNWALQPVPLTGQQESVPVTGQPSSVPDTGRKRPVTGAEVSRDRDDLSTSLNKVKKGKKDNMGEAPSSPALNTLIDGIAKDYYGLQPRSGDPLERKAVTAFYKRWRTLLQEIMDYSKGNPTFARRGVDAVVARLHKKGISDFTIGAIAKNFTNWSAEPDQYEKDTKRL